MTKKNSDSNIIQMPQRTTNARSKSESLRLAQDKVYEAWEATGKKRAKLAQEALALSEDCADAYLLLADGLKKDQEKIELYRKAVAAGERSLGKNWEKEFKGHCWLVFETRPVMRAIARLAIKLREMGEFEEAINLFRKLIELNPNDNQGVRHLFAACLYETKCDQELQNLLKKYRDDVSADLLYIKALHLFRLGGQSKISDKALKEAFKANPYVPIFLSDVVEMPRKPPASIGLGDDREAIAYVMDQGYLWFVTEGATNWMAEKLAPALRQEIDDKELVEDVIDALKGDYRR